MHARVEEPLSASIATVTSAPGSRAPRLLRNSWRAPRGRHGYPRLVHDERGGEEDPASSEGEGTMRPVSEGWPPPAGYATVASRTIAYVGGAARPPAGFERSTLWTLVAMDVRYVSSKYARRVGAGPGGRRHRGRRRAGGVVPRGAAGASEGAAGRGGEGETSAAGRAPHVWREPIVARECDLGPNAGRVCARASHTRRIVVPRTDGEKKSAILFSFFFPRDASSDDSTNGGASLGSRTVAPARYFWSRYFTFFRVQ